MHITDTDKQELSNAEAGLANEARVALPEAPRSAVAARNSSLDHLEEVSVEFSRPLATTAAPGLPRAVKLEGETPQTVSAIATQLPVYSHAFQKETALISGLCNNSNVAHVWDLSALHHRVLAPEIPVNTTGLSGLPDMSYATPRNDDSVKDSVPCCTSTTNSVFVSSGASPKHSVVQAEQAAAEYSLRFLVVTGPDLEPEEWEPKESFETLQLAEIEEQPAFQQSPNYYGLKFTFFFTNCANAKEFKVPSGNKTEFAHLKLKVLMVMKRVQSDKHQSGETVFQLWIEQLSEVDGS